MDVFIFEVDGCEFFLLNLCLVWFLICFIVFEYFILFVIGVNCIVLVLSILLLENDRMDLFVKFVSDWKFKCFYFDFYILFYN